MTSSFTENFNNSSLVSWLTKPAQYIDVNAVVDDKKK